MYTVKYFCSIGHVNMRLIFYASEIIFVSIIRSLCDEYRVRNFRLCIQ
jgi:hypothetical protein